MSWLNEMNFRPVQANAVIDGGATMSKGYPPSRSQLQSLCSAVQINSVADRNVGAAMLAGMDLPYQIACTEKVRNLDKELAHELNELKNEIEENEMVHGIQRAASSIPLPKDIGHFQRERALVIKRSMEVCEAKPLSVQANIMQEELDNATKSDYRPECLPLLLHHFFIERMHQLVQCKHMHMLRWKRFCDHTKAIEPLHAHYSTRMQQIMREYTDAMSRAERLSCAREAYLAGSPLSAPPVVQLDDLLIYLRWFVCHLHSIKKFNQYLKVLQWVPVVHKSDLAVNVPEVKEEDDPGSSARIPARYADDSSFMAKSTSSRPSSGQSSHSYSAGGVPPTPPPLNPLLLSTNPMTSSQFAYAAAAGGGGLASDEDTLRMPLNMNDLDSLRPQLNFLAHLYGMSVDVEQISTSAEEMELYATITRRFRQLYTRQEHMKTFKTYDRVEVGQENWGADSSIHALKQEANWLPFIKLKGERDPLCERKLVELRSRNDVDHLLGVMSRFLYVTEPEKVQDTLREHAMAVRDPRKVTPVSVQSNKTSYHTGAIWKRIYTNPNLFNKQQDEDDIMQEFDEKEADNVNFSSGSRSANQRRRRDSYDYVDTVQLLGLDEGEQDSNDPTSIQGAFLSFLQLRHLRIRDLQRTCLSILNYFRSVERTLTINDGGLSLESGKFRRSSPQDHRRQVIDGGSGGGGGLPSHHYVHNTPKDFKISETEFMEFSDVENHDDFYTIEEGRVHVQDQRGYFIVYDVTLDDFKKLEHDLLLIATHFIAKDRDLRNASGIRRSESARRARSTVSAGDFDIPSYGHQEVDRFGVLLDLWSNEAAFLECKKELLDCYLEAYHHVFDRDEKRGLAQVITSLMSRRPRYDFEAEYFVKIYRLECVCLRLEATLVKNILDSHVDEQREYIQKVCRQGDSELGLPHKVIPKQPISINMSRSALKNVYILEFHPSLSFASRLPAAIKHAYWETLHVHHPSSITQRVLLYKRLLEVAQREWNRMESLGSSYGHQVQKDLFSDVFVEDPLFICEIAQTLVSRVEQAAGRLTLKEKQVAVANNVGRLLDLIQRRYQLIETAWESEILSKIYRKQAVEMGYDECHLFLRFVQFEFASFKEDAGKPPPLFITAIQEDDSGLDRFVPNHLYLGIHEVDESHVGRFSFRSRDGILQLMRPGGLESFCTVLEAQVVHKNALMASVQQANLCQPTVATMPSSSGRPLTPTETKSEKSTLTALSVSTGTVPSLGGKLSSSVPTNKYTRSPEAFVSLQLEKGPSRDLMLNDFIHKKSTQGTALKKPEEVEKLKRKLISEYCYRFNQRLMQYSLRGQIIASYNSILGLLHDFPNIRETYFMLGEPNEKKTEMDTIKGLEPDPRSMRKRPRRVISYDGRHVLNLWFIPHHSELLVMFKKMEEEACKRALTYCLRIVCALHDILQYLCAHAHLGSSHARLGSHKMEFVSADWGGTEGIGADLREIQREWDNLSTRKTDPETVCRFLELRRDVMFLEFDAAVRHSMRDTFLATGNVAAYNAISECMHFALDDLSNSQKPALGAIYLNVPEPLEARDPFARDLFPWRSFMNRNGPYPMLLTQGQEIESNMQLCLAGLKEVDRHVANGEILGVSLLMEDVLTLGQQDRAITMTPIEEDMVTELDSGGNQAVAIPDPLGEDGKVIDNLSNSSRPSTAHSRAPSMLSIARKDRAAKKPLSRTEKPIEAYMLLRSFMLLWKRLEICKFFWGCQRLGLEKIDTAANYKNFCIEYRKEILYPVLAGVARRYGQADMYEGMVSETEPLIIPKGAPEMEIRLRQLVKLLEGLECHMIGEVRKRLAKEFNLVLAERAREESALPTDLWKRPSMKESFTLNKPHIAEDFIERLMSECKETDEEFTFPREHLNSCLASLASAVMQREKHNFESYSMYYENIQRAYHQQLYQREQEVKQARDQVVTMKANQVVDVQCALADSNYDLLVEITALRAKIAEMRLTLMDQERHVRDRVRHEYDELVTNLFSSAFTLKRKFDEFREGLYDSVYQKITEASRDASIAMTRLRSGNVKDEEVAGRNLAQANHVRQIQRQNHDLNVLVTKLRSMNQWKQSHNKSRTNIMMSDLRKDAEHSKKEYLEVKMLAEEEVILLRQQLVAVRGALRTSEQECTEVKKELEKELKAKKEKLHAAQQNAQSQKQLEEARRANIDKLLDELDDKEGKLRVLADEKNRNVKLHSLISDKISKDLSSIRKQLHHERHLKLDAFQRVDDLQSQIYDFEVMGIPSRPHTAMAASSSRNKSRLSSATKGRSAAPSSGGVWPPPVPWPANRSLTPAADFNSTLAMNNVDAKKIQRPKTTIGRLRSRIADQLLNELEPPDHHETLVQLRQLKEQQQQQREKSF